MLLQSNLGKLRIRKRHNEITIQTQRTTITIKRKEMQMKKDKYFETPVEEVNIEDKELTDVTFAIVVIVAMLLALRFAS